MKPRKRAVDGFVGTRWGGEGRLAPGTLCANALVLYPTSLLKPLFSRSKLFSPPQCSLTNANEVMFKSQ